MPESESCTCETDEDVCPQHAGTTRDDTFVLLTRRVIVRAPKDWDDEKADAAIRAFEKIMDIQLELTMATVRQINSSLTCEVIS